MCKTLIFTKPELDVIESYLPMFDTIKRQYAIFQYINSEAVIKNIYAGMNRSLSEALFRHIIIELYGLFFDDSTRKGEVSYPTIIKKLKSYVGYSTRTHNYQATIEYHNVDDNSIKPTHMDSSIILEPFILEMSKMSKIIKNYRHKVLAHKYAYNDTEHKEFKYHITRKNLNSLMQLCEQILVRLFKVAFPQNCRDDMITHYIDDEEVFNYFNKLVESKCGAATNGSAV